MAAVSRFEDLLAWQRARALVVEVYGLARRETMRQDFALSGQITRAAVSVMSNIAEGFARHSSKDFSRFLGMSIASCAEVRSQLCIALDLSYISSEEFDSVHALAIEVSKLTKALRASVPVYSA